MNKEGMESRFRLVINNEIWHHTALDNISKGFGYYPHEIICKLLYEVTVGTLRSENDNGKISRVQYYVLSEKYSIGADGGR